MRILPCLAVMTLALAGCSGMDGVNSAADATPCENDPLASFIGQKVSADLGAKMLAVAHARTLRWGPPNTAMTMDFRADRLTVSYDQGMIITAASCG